MKNKINMLLFLFLLGSSAIILAQDEDENTITPLTEEIIPTAVKNAVKKDFPNYLVTQYSGTPQERIDDEFVEESDGGLIDDFEGFLVNLTGQENELMATYSFEGKLLNVLSDKPNDTLSPNVIAKISKSYPGWEIVNNNRHLIGDTVTYFVVINKGDDTITLQSDEDGNLVKN